MAMFSFFRCEKPMQSYYKLLKYKSFLRKKLHFRAFFCNFAV